MALHSGFGGMGGDWHASVFGFGFGVSVWFALVSLEGWLLVFLFKGSFGMDAGGYILNFLFDNF